MKLLRLSVAVATVLYATSAFSQTTSYRPPAARTHVASGGILAPAASSPAVAVVEFLRTQGLTVPANALVEETTVRAQNGVAVVRLEERAGGLTIHGVYAKASFNANGELIHLIENLVSIGPVAAGRTTPAQALGAALQRQYGNAVASPPQARTQGNTVVFARTPFFHSEPTATRVAIVGASGSLRAATLVETWSEQENLLHHTLVGGDGEILDVELRTSSDRYNVFTKDPGKTVQTVISGPGSTTASPAGWLGSGAQSTVNISGNNANAYLDADGNNRPDKGGTAVSNGDFLTAWGGDGTSPSTTANRNVAVQNLFYLNNVVHDTLYGYGFTESAGNFQINNFGKGGAGNDPVLAEAQDGSGTDNANFATPSDGRSPRMQMYLWSNPAADSEVVVGASSFAAKKAEFTALSTTGVTGALAVVNDGTAPTSDGCESLSGLTGRVAVIDRGTCTFKLKVANAQAAGAVGVIIVNNVPGDAFFAMGDDPNVRTRIRIPAVMVGNNAGATLKSLSGSSSTVRDLPGTLPMIDASLDSDVVFHEYGHGLTWRMIGSMSGPLAGAIGEGASDGVALLINGDDVIGEYSSGSPSGIRRAPYTGYPLTYGSVKGEEVHNDGEVFAAIIWRLREVFTVDGRPLDTLFRLYVDGMNFTPARPAWEDMRDGMLQSAANAGGVDTCRIWTAFAQYGVGVGADGVENADGTATVTESFIKPAACN